MPPGRRSGVRRSLLVSSILIAFVVAAGCAGAAEEPPQSQAGGSWVRLPDLPLSERAGPVVVWTGKEVLAVGGEVGDTCPPNADCSTPNASAADGAALDLESRTWRPIANAPLEIPAHSPHALVGEQLFVVAQRTLLVYDVVEDRWDTVLGPVNAWYHLASDGDRLVLVSGSDEQGVRRDLVYTPATGAWSRLADDPLGPSYDRALVATRRGLLLSAKDLVASPGAGSEPSYVEAALLDRESGQWRAFGPSDRLGGGWVALGDRAVAVRLGSSDGGGSSPGGDYGREIPEGGRLDLVTGRWSDLPDAPAEGSGGWPVDAAGSRWVAAGGYLYDDTLGTWVEVPRPDGSAVGPGPAVWADDTLVVVTGTSQGETNAEIRSNASWSWTPPAP